MTHISNICSVSVKRVDETVTMEERGQIGNEE